MKTLPADHEVMHTLPFPTFSAASNDAGLSRRYGGIHFQSGDYAGGAWADRSPSSSGYRPEPAPVQRADAVIVALDGRLHHA